MPLIYSLVARDTVILAEFTSFTSTSGNFTTVTRRILERIPQKESKMSYVYDRFAGRPPPSLRNNCALA